MPVFKNIQILVNWAFLMSARKLFERRGFTRDRERLIWAGFFASRSSRLDVHLNDIERKNILFCL